MKLSPCQWLKVQTADKKKFEQTLHLVSVFLLQFFTSKQMSVVVLVVLQDRYLRATTIQPITKLQGTDAKTTSENLIISFLENKKVHEGLTKKRILFLSTTFA